MKKEMTHIGTLVRLSRDSSNGNEQLVRLRETKKRWYREHGGSWWPKESSHGDDMVRNGTKQPRWTTSSWMLKLSSVRPLTLLEMRAPLVEAVRSAKQLCEEKELELIRLREVEAEKRVALERFDAKHKESS